VAGIEVEDRGKAAVLRLQNGVTNAIGPDMVCDLLKLLPVLERDFRGLVLAGGEKFFSIGFDLPALLRFGEADMADFFTKLNALTLALYSIPIPTCAAVCGHAVGGGNILALACDYRIAALGKKRVGLNEVKLGVPVPYLADLILRQVVGDRGATEMLYSGELMGPEDALRIGLVDEVHPVEAVEGRAIEKISVLAALPPAALSAIKANRVESVRSKYEENRRVKDAFFLSCWFSPPVKELLEAASKKF
jgi:enoyl-CoA hydratase/carnithine racemase